MDYNGDSNNTIMTWDFPPFSWFSCVLGSIRLSPKYTGWWFGTFFIFPYIGNNNPSLLIFFRGVETTNQYIYIYVTIGVNLCKQRDEPLTSEALCGPPPGALHPTVGFVRLAAAFRRFEPRLSLGIRSIRSIRSFKVVPPFDNVQLVNITPITMVYIGDISIVNGVINQQT